MFSYSLDKIGHNMSIRFIGDLDIEVSEVMEEEIIPVLGGSKQVDFDFSRVPFVDSTGIGLLINLVEILKKNGEGVQIKINKIQPLVKEVFDMLQLQEILGDEVQLLG
jgi:anti-anti-sigma factor